MVGTDFDTPLQKFCEWATGPFHSIFQKISPLEKRVYTLQDFLYPDKQNYTLHVGGMI